MRAVFLARASRLLAALLFVACHATAQTAATCADWQVKFHNVQATWQGSATPRSEVERAFGSPSRVEQNGACTSLNYAVAGCSCWFTVCSEGTVVSKTLTIGAGAVPAFLTNDPSVLAGDIETLQDSMREIQAQIAKLQQVVDGLAPPPGPALAALPPKVTAPPAVSPKPPAPRPARQCAALTKKGVRCTRHAVEGSNYCWQHRQ